MSSQQPSPVAIRRARTTDAAALAAFAARTFVEAFGADNKPDDLAKHLAEAYGVPQQTAQIANTDWITLLAEVDRNLAGYAQVRRGSAAPPCMLGEKPVELYRFYVDQRWHGRGVAQALMREVTTAAVELGAATLWLSTWERNPRGRAFYAKVGFADVGSADFWVGNDRQTDRILSLALTD